MTVINFDGTALEYCCCRFKGIDENKRHANRNV